MIVGAILIVAGVVFILCRKSFTKGAAAWQRENFGIRPRHSILKFGEATFLVGGLAFVLIGLLALFGAIKFQ
jgi:hypothetical protein